MCFCFMVWSASAMTPVKISSQGIYKIYLCLLSSLLVNFPFDYFHLLLRPNTEHDVDWKWPGHFASDVTSGIRLFVDVEFFFFLWYSGSAQFKRKWKRSDCWCVYYQYPGTSGVPGRVCPPHDPVSWPCSCITTVEAPVLLLYFHSTVEAFFSFLLCAPGNIGLPLASPQHGRDLCSQFEVVLVQHWHSVVSGVWGVVEPQHPEFERNRGLRREDTLYRCSSTSCPGVSACSLWKFHPPQPAEAKHETCWFKNNNCFQLHLQYLKLLQQPGN